MPGLEPDPTFGNWTCTWGTDPHKSIAFNDKDGWTELAEVMVETERDTPERLREMAIGVATSVAEKLPRT